MTLGLIILAIIILGIIILCIVRCCFTIYDRREYARFEKELEKSKWEMVKQIFMTWSNSCYLSLAVIMWSVCLGWKPDLQTSNNQVHEPNEMRGTGLAKVRNISAPPTARRSCRREHNVTWLDLTFFFVLLHLRLHLLVAAVDFIALLVCFRISPSDVILRLLSLNLCCRIKTMC